MWPDENGVAKYQCHTKDCDFRKIRDAIFDGVEVGGDDLVEVPANTNGSGPAKATKEAPILDPDDRALLIEAVGRLQGSTHHRRVLIEERALSDEVINLYALGTMSEWDQETSSYKTHYIVPVLSWLDREPKGRPLTYVKHKPRSTRSEGEKGVKAPSGGSRWCQAAMDPGVWTSGSGTPVWVTEGELDALTVRSAGHPALSAPGAGSWNVAYRDELVKYGVKSAVVIGDRGSAGEKFTQTAATSIAAAGIDVRVAQVPLEHEGADVTDWLRDLPVDDRHGALESLAAFSPPHRRATVQDPPPADPCTLAPPEGGGNAEAPELAFEPDLLAANGDLLRSCGLIGEMKLGAIVFLAAISALLSRPASVAVKGPSSGGKSHVVKMALDPMGRSARGVDRRSCRPDAPRGGLSGRR